MKSIPSSEGRRGVALVTGASRGIGRATAIRLAEDFSAVAVVARTADALEDTAVAMRGAGADALVIAADLREPAVAERVIGGALARFGRLDALVNIAGAVPQTDLFDMPDEEWADGLSLKFHAARRLTIGAWEALKASRGSVVFTSGTTAIAPKASLGAVSAINAAIAALAKAFAERGINDGVQVNSILPGPVLTDRRRNMLKRFADAQSLDLNEATKRFAAEAGIARYGAPEDVAEAIAFLVAPNARWIVGAALRVDGGETKSV